MNEKPRGSGFSKRPRGLERGCIHDPRSMHIAVGDGRETCIKITRSVGGGRGDRYGNPTGVYEWDGNQSPQIDGFGTPVHTGV